MISQQRLLLRIQLGVIVSFVLVKFLLRPFVLEQRYTGISKIFVLSYPNFCEAIVGTIMLTYLLLIAKATSKRLKIKEQYLYGIAVLLSATYVVLQELKVHNLGGENVYDPLDVLFSIFGLIFAYILIQYLKPTPVNR